MSACLLHYISRTMPSLTYLGIFSHYGGYLCKIANSLKEIKQALVKLAIG